MNSHQIELAASIVGLARSIQPQTGRYSTYSEHHHEDGGFEISVSIMTGADPYGFTWFTGGDAVESLPSLETMRDELARWISDNRIATTGAQSANA